MKKFALQYDLEDGRTGRLEPKVEYFNTKEKAEERKKYLESLCGMAWGLWIQPVEISGEEEPFDPFA